MKMSLLGWLDDPATGKGLRVFDGGSGEWRAHTYEKVAALTRRAAARLLAHGARPGDVVVLVRTASPEFVADFFGALLIGVTPAPVAPPNTIRDHAAYVEHVRRVVRLLGARLLVTTDEVAQALAPRPGESAWPCRIVTGIPVDIAPLESAAPPPPIGLVQFSSGSTGRPRGIRLAFDTLEAHVAMIHQWLRIGPEDSFASWLPLHHDMGLIGLLLMPVHRCRDLWLMRPEEFVRAPLQWLSVLGRGDANRAASPTFGLAHVARRVRPERLDGLDLRGFRTLLVGAERVEPATLDAFVELLGPAGFRREAFCPAYGMAEATLAVTGVAVDGGYRSHRVDPVSLELGEAVRPVAVDEPGTTLVGCGPALPGVGIRVVDGDGRPVPAGTFGEIETSGYTALDSLSDEGTTRYATTRRTGDAGFIHEGELYVLGRLGDGVKQLGRWYFAEDIEQLVYPFSPRPQQTVALIGSLRGRHTIAVVVEGKVPEPERIGAPTARQNPALRVIVLSAKAGTIARTTSGKVRRGAMWGELAAGRLDGATVWDSDRPLSESVTG